MHEVSELFAGQDGLATTAQLYERGVTIGLIRTWVATGEWERLAPSLIGVAGSPRTWRRRVRAALLSAGPDAALSHTTAARLHGFDGFDAAEELHVTTFARRHHTPMPGVSMHRSRVLTRRDCLVVGGMLCVSRPIALFQIAATNGREAAGRALDSMLRAGDSSIWIGRVASAWRRPGVTGPAEVLDLLNERVDQRLPRSWFQRLAKRVLAERGLVLVDEHPVRSDHGALIAELDLAIAHLRIGVECQSWRWHATPSARAADACRKRRLRMLGWEVVEVWWTDLGRIDEIVAEIAYLIDRQTERHPVP